LEALESKIKKVETKLKREAAPPKGGGSHQVTQRGARPRKKNAMKGGAKDASSEYKVTACCIIVLSFGNKQHKGKKNPNPIIGPLGKRRRYCGERKKAVGEGGGNREYCGTSQNPRESNLLMKKDWGG